ncbi:MAG: cupin domain-containing protein [Halopseudomonas sp.]
MKKSYLIKHIFTVMVLGLISFSALADGAKITPLIEKDLDGLMNKEGAMLIVEYGPGMSSKKHRHDAHIFAYVLEGSVVMQVDGSGPVTLEVGDVFYESPNDIHLVSKNASTTQTAKFVVFSVKEKNHPVVIPVQ